jgi:transcriptional regulator with XRE-family HTH domain
MHVMNEENRAATENVPRPEQIVARHIRLLRQGRGWSQQEVAEKMRPYGYEWSQATVTRLESATRPIRLNELADLATLFGVPVTQFLESRGPGSGWDDLEALDNELASLTAERDALKAQLDEACYRAMVAAEYEGSLRAQMARIDSRLETLIRWHPKAAEARRERLKEMLDSGSA